MFQFLIIKCWRAKNMPWSHQHMSDIKKATTTNIPRLSQAYGPITRNAKRLHWHRSTATTSSRCVRNRSKLPRVSGSWHWRSFKRLQWRPALCDMFQWRFSSVQHLWVFVGGSPNKKTKKTEGIQMDVVSCSPSLLLPCWSLWSAFALAWHMIPIPEVLRLSHGYGLK